MNREALFLEALGLFNFQYFYSSSKDGFIEFVKRNPFLIFFNFYLVQSGRYQNVKNQSCD